MYETAYVISLNNAVERRKHITTMFSSLNINFEFFDAIDKNEALSKCKDNNLNYLEGSLTLGELGCFMSHYLLWKKLINKNMPYMLIFEDDVVVSSRINEFMEHIGSIVSKLGIVRLETLFTPAVYDKNNLELFGFNFLKLKTEHMGSAGYVISIDIAKELISFINERGVFKPIDHYVYLRFLRSSDSIELFQITPALVVQDDVLNSNQDNHLVSSLEYERKLRVEVKPKEVKRNKFLYELKRLWSQISIKYWITKKRNKKRDKLIKHNGIVIPFDTDYDDGI